MDASAATGRVLVIDDDSGVASLFARILVAEGYRVQTAPDFGSAQDLLDREPPDVILLDVVLPDG